MEAFLKSHDLGEIVGIFDKHQITIEMLDFLTDDLLRELIPIVGYRIRLKWAIEGRVKGKPAKRKAISSSCVIKKQKRNDPKTRKEIIEALHDDLKLINLYELAVNILIELSLFSFRKGCSREVPRGWELINFDKGALICPLCNRPSVPHLRIGGKVFWNVHNFKRHLVDQHKLKREDNVASNSNDPDGFEMFSFDDVCQVDSEEWLGSRDMESLLELTISDDVQMLYPKSVSISNPPEVIHQNNPPESSNDNLPESAINTPPESSNHNLPEASITALETTNDLNAETNQERTNSNEILIQQESEITASIIANRYTTEEEAKVALSERHCIARQEDEKQAELERQRKEAEELAKQQHIAEEENRKRLEEEEKLRSVEEQKKTDELRLLKAIEEAKQKEEDERERKAIAQIEREESERKVREEGEKQKFETAGKLRKEKKEGKERHKCGEAIMLRTRKGAAPGNISNKNGNGEGDQISRRSNSDSDSVKTSKIRRRKP